jgi:hypothetical protein
MKNSKLQSEFNFTMFQVIVGFLCVPGILICAQLILVTEAAKCQVRENYQSSHEASCKIVYNIMQAQDDLEAQFSKN